MYFRGIIYSNILIVLPHNADYVCYGGIMTRLYSLILSLCMMFNITGCASITDIEQPAQSEIVTETI